MAQKKRIGELSFAKIKKLRSEIVLNSLYYSDYTNSLGYDPHDVYAYFNAYFGFLYDLAARGDPLWDKRTDMERISVALNGDNAANLKAFHESYDML